MINLLIFILALPFFILAVLMIPLGLMVDVFAAFVLVPICLISILRGEDPLWSIFLVPPLMGLAMYGELTGFFDLDWLLF